MADSNEMSVSVFDVFDLPEVRDAQAEAWVRGYTTATDNTGRHAARWMVWGFTDASHTLVPGIVVMDSAGAFYVFMGGPDRDRGWRDPFTREVAGDDRVRFPVRVAGVYR